MCRRCRGVRRTLGATSALGMIFIGTGTLRPVSTDVLPGSCRVRSVCVLDACTFDVVGDRASEGCFRVEGTAPLYGHLAGGGGFDGRVRVCSRRSGVLQSERA